MNSRGLAGVLVASLLLSIIASAYVVYQAQGVPGYCKNAERKMLEDFLSGLRDLAARQRNVIGSGETSGVRLETQYPYPSIPFFLTPSYASASYSAYDISVTVSNIASDQLQIPQSITLEGKALNANFNPVFSTPVTAFLELGILATDGAYLDGSPVSRGEIYLPFFDGSPSMQLYPASAGGKGVVIRPFDPAKNITVTVSGSKIPGRVWEAYSNASGYLVNITSANGTQSVTIEVPPRSYLLKSGVASFVGGKSEQRPAYLRALSPPVQKAPAVASVEALDCYFNPATGNISLSFVSGSWDYSVKIATPSGLQEVQLPYSITDSRLSTILEVRNGISVFKASITRAAGEPYEVAFAVSQ